MALEAVDARRAKVVRAGAYGTCLGHGMDRPWTRRAKVVAAGASRLVDRVVVALVVRLRPARPLCAAPPLEPLRRLLLRRRRLSAHLSWRGLVGPARPPRLRLCGSSLSGGGGSLLCRRGAAFRRLRPLQRLAQGRL